MGKAQSLNIQDASPRRLLVAWANNQDAWIRELVAETILSRKVPSDEALEHVFETFLAEKGLSEDPSPEVPLLELDDREETAEDVLELLSIDDILGVNALAAGYAVEFDSGLTILFGQNGSGKTGYARIVKRIAAVRSAEQILPNAHASGLQPSPSARIKYRLGGLDQEVQWKNEAGLAPFTRISVFDSFSTNIHADAELGYVFTPAELALFKAVADGIHKVLARIAAEVSGLKPGANTLLPLFTRGTAVYRVIESLGPTTEFADLDHLSMLDEEAPERRDQLEQEVNALRGGALDALVAAAQQKQASLGRLRSLAQAVASFDAAAYGSALEALAQAEAERRRAREELFSADELPGPPDNDWQRFVAAGETYRQHLDLEHYPAEGDQCLYCRQDLASSALDLVGRYRTFLDESLVRHVTEATSRVDGFALKLSPAQIIGAQQDLAAMAMDTNRPVWADSMARLLEDAIRTVDDGAARRVCATPDLGAQADVLVNTLTPEVTLATQQAKDLAEQQANRTAALASKQKELNELSARIELNKHLAAAKSFVTNAKTAARLEQLSKHVSHNALKQLTEQSKLASEDLVNKSFEQLFAEECGALRAPKVALEFQGRSGKAERRKVVASHRPSQILSEGEQKVLALADFLAESRMRGTKAPIVFDDPVTSLDYRRVKEVASRIAKLAESHQVIVFTHNVMFASTLIDMRQNKKLRCKFYEVRDEGDSKGILAPDVEPRLDNPADIGKKVNKLIDNAKAQKDPAVQDALIEHGYGLMRAWCEAFVEQELLKNVTQRYRPNIMMAGLSKIDTDRFPEAVAVVGPIFDKACRCMAGHSQPEEQLNVRTTLSELEQDWAKLQDARKAYIGS